MASLSMTSSTNRASFEEVPNKSDFEMWQEYQQPIDVDSSDEELPSLDEKPSKRPRVEATSMSASIGTNMAQEHQPNPLERPVLSSVQMRVEAQQEVAPMPHLVPITPGDTAVQERAVEANEKAVEAPYPLSSEGLLLQGTPNFEHQPVGEAASALDEMPIGVRVRVNLGQGYFGTISENPRASDNCRVRCDGDSRSVQIARANLSMAEPMVICEASSGSSSEAPTRAYTAAPSENATECEAASKQPSKEHLKENFETADHQANIDGEIASMANASSLSDNFKEIDSYLAMTPEQPTKEIFAVDGPDCGASPALGRSALFGSPSRCKSQPRDDSESCAKRRKVTEHDAPDPARADEAGASTGSISNLFSAARLLSRFGFGGAS